MKSHTREHQAYFTVFSSSRAPQSRVLLPVGAPPKTNRHSSRHLQDILVAGLGFDFVPSHTRVFAPNGQRWRCHFVSALQLVPIFFTSDIHTLFPHKDLIIGKTFACQTAYIINGECVSCLWALQGTACSSGTSYASVTCCRVFLCTALPISTVTL